MALRYPKLINTGTIRGAQGGMNGGSSGIAPFVSTFQVNCNVTVAPSRYSNVRKVIFYLNTGQLGNGTEFTGRLALRIAALGSQLASPEKFTLANSGTHIGLTDFGFTPTGFAFPTKRGPSTTILRSVVTANERDLAQMMTIEFDRFEPDAADFFAAWDAFDSDDDYMLIQPSVLIDSDDSGGFLILPRFKNWQCAITQAPGPNNTSSTDWSTFIGTNDAVEGTVAFQGPLFGPRMPFLYREADWDGLTNVSIFQYGTVTGTTTSVTVRLFDLTAAAIVFDEVFALAPTNRWYCVRTQNFLANLIDGHLYFVDYRLNAANSNLDPRANSVVQFIQKGFTKTVCLHQITNLSFTPTAVDRCDGGAIVFDPTWYEDFSDEQILDRKIFSAFAHNAASNNPRIVMRLDTDLLSDDRLRASGTAVDMSPEHTFTGSPLEPQFQFTDILANDPIDLAGVRRMQKSYLGSSTWLAAPGDFPGELGLYYVLDVPESDQPELGPLFALDAFVAEGCAATAAGLGDPGVLVITNGSSIPQKFDPVANLVENNGIQAPFCDEIPQATTEDTGASPLNGLSIGFYAYRYTFRNCCTLKESDPSPDILIVDTTGNSPAAKVTLSFAGLRIPSDDQICEICVYRSLVAASPEEARGLDPILAKVGCFDFTVSTLFVDDVADAALDFINDGLSLLNAPMPCVPVVAEFRNRLFGMGDIPQLSPAGTVDVVLGSDIITGSNDVEWDRCLEGKYIQVQGDCRVYEIDKVLPPDEGISPPIGRLKLIDDYEGDTDLNLNYIFCGRPNRLYFSEPLEAECWPAINFLDVEAGDGDRLMGAISNFNRLIICKRNKTYVLTFRDNPLLEVTVPARISSDIGCIGPRTFAQYESGSVWLADRGLASFDGRAVSHVPESAEMNQIFTDPDNPRYVRRDRNGRVIDAVGVFYPKAEQYLLILPTVQTTRGCNLMLVWDVKLRNITLLEFCQQFQSMVVAKDSDGNERVYLGDTDGFVWIYDIGDNDGVGFPNATGTVRGTVSAAGLDLPTGASFLDDNSASFLRGGLPGLGGLSGIAGLSGAFFAGDLGLAGVCLFTRAAGAAPDDPWIQRTVFASTSTRLFITPSWGLQTPAPGDDYMLGPIQFLSTFKVKNYGTDDDQKRQWKHIIVHEPEAVASQLRVQLLPDFQLSDPGEPFLLDAEGEEQENAERVFDMSFKLGRQVASLNREVLNFEQVKLSNFAPEEPIRILNHYLRVALRGGG